MATFSIKIATISPNEPLIHMLLTTLSTSWSFSWLINIYPLLRSRVRNRIIDSLGEILMNLVLKTLLELRLVINVKPTLRKTTFLVNLFVPLPQETIFFLMCMKHQPRNNHVVIKAQLHDIVIQPFRKRPLHNNSVHPYYLKQKNKNIWNA